jgi:hypothetical protein
VNRQTIDRSNVIALIAFQYGQGKVVAGPLDGMDRPYGPTAVDGFNVISEPVVENKLLVNAINWVAMPKYELTVTSSPVLGVPFSVDSVPRVTPSTDAFAQGQHVLEMPETFGGYIWSHWLEDGNTSRTKTINIQDDPTWTGIYVLASPPALPVGGEWIPINKLQLLAPWISLISLMTMLATSFVFARRKRRQN